MDATEKLLKQITTRDRKRLITALEALQQGEISGIKLTGKNEYRLRVGSYRIIYRLEQGEIEIVGVRRRREDTYK